MIASSGLAPHTWEGAPTAASAHGLLAGSTAGPCSFVRDFFGDGLTCPPGACRAYRGLPIEGGAPSGSVDKTLSPILYHAVTLRAHTHEKSRYLQNYITQTPNFPLGFNENCQWRSQLCGANFKNAQSSLEHAYDITQLGVYIHLASLILKVPPLSSRRRCRSVRKIGWCPIGWIRGGGWSCPGTNARNPIYICINITYVYI